MFGVSLPENFRFPYAARNIADFWQRWHMSLSTWIRDYVYIPLGGSRHGSGRRILNLSLTMFLCGLWHGAAWHYGVWGLYHGLGLAIHAAFDKVPRSRRLAEFRPGCFAVPLQVAGVALTNVFVAYGWLLFFYPLETVLRLTRCLLFHEGAP
jgi:alginate O-acetyltransferase complex protein AlgI